MTTRFAGLCVLLLLGCSLASAAPSWDAVVFIRDGQVWLDPAGPAEPRRLISDDPGWTYTQPVWIDRERILVMRMKQPLEPGRSHVGILTVANRPVAPGDINWLPKLGGSWSIGVDHVNGRLIYVKVPKDDVFEDWKVDLYVGFAALDGSNPTSRKVVSPGADLYTWGRTNCSADGRLLTLPLFPTDVSTKTYFFDVGAWARRKLAPETEPDIIDLMTAQFLPDGGLLAWTFSQGLLHYPPDGRRRLLWQNIPENGMFVSDLTVSRDGRWAYLGSSWNEWESSTDEARIWRLNLESGHNEVYLADAAEPHVLPAWAE